MKASPTVRYSILAAAIAIAFIAASTPSTSAGSEPTQVTTTGGRHPTVSRDGLWIAYTAADGGIVRIPTTGGEVEILTTSGYEPDWGRTGSLIVFQDGSALYTVDAETHETQLVRDGGFDDGPAWSPAGDEIATQSTSSSITTIAYPGGGLETIPCSDPDGSECEGEGPTWSPDASAIAFEDGVDLLRVARSGGMAELVYHCPTDLSRPAWSPDGRWIAVVVVEYATPAENTHLWVVDSRDVSYGFSQLTVGDVEDSAPAWSPDGQTIYFESDRSGQSEIWKIDFLTPSSVERTTWGQIKSRFR